MDDLPQWLSLVGVVLLLAVWTLVVRIYPAVLGASFIRRINHNYDVKLENLKAELQAEYSSLESSVHFLALSQSELRSKVIKSVESLWRGSIAAKNEFDDAAIMLELISPDNLEKFFRSGDKGLDAIVGKYRELSHVQVKIDRVNENVTEDARLYAGDRLWLLFYFTRAFYGRTGILVYESYSSGSYCDWRSDELIDEQLEAVLSSDIIAKAKADQVKGHRTIGAHLEAEFLKEATRVMSGSNRLAESLSDIEATISHRRADIESRRVAGDK